MDTKITDDLKAYISTPEDEGKHPGLIIIHEIWGLNEHTKDIARRFAKEGYVSLAPDLMTGTGIEDIVTPELIADMQNPEKKDATQQKMRAALAPIQSPEFAEKTVEKLKECFEFLEKQSNVNGKIAVLGFCFGGTYAYALAAEEPKLKAAVPFYGHAPEEDKIKRIFCPILAFYGALDIPLSEELLKISPLMTRHKIKFDAYVYKNTGHAFFNDTNPQRYNKEAAEDSWKKTLSFLSENL